MQFKQLFPSVFTHLLGWNSSWETSTDSEGCTGAPTASMWAFKKKISQSAFSFIRCVCNPVLPACLKQLLLPWLQSSSFFYNKLLLPACAAGLGQTEQSLSVLSFSVLLDSTGLLVLSLQFLGDFHTLSASTYTPQLAVFWWLDIQLPQEYQ